MIDSVDHRARVNFSPLGVITLITLAAPTIDWIDQERRKTVASRFANHGTLYHS